MSRLDLLTMTSGELLHLLAGSGHSMENPDRDTIQVVLQARAANQRISDLVVWLTVTVSGAPLWARPLDRGVRHDRFHPREFGAAIQSLAQPRTRSAQRRRIPEASRQCSGGFR